MKKILSICAFALIAVFASAQDIIVTNNLETIKAYRIDIGSSSVYYSLADSNDADVKRINKSNILVIKFADGHTWTNESGQNAATKQASTNAVTAGKTSVSPDNKKCIAEFNSRCERLFPEWITKTKPKTTKGTFAYFGALHMTDDSVLSDGTLKIDVNKGFINMEEKIAPPYREFSLRNTMGPNRAFYFEFQPAWQLVLENQSSDYIYVDLSSCYIKANGKIYPFFDSKTSDVISTDVSSKSVGGAVPIPFGAVGGMSTSGKATSTVSIKNIAIAPYSSVNTFAIIIEKDIDSSYSPIFADDYLGYIHDFTYEQSPYKMEIRVIWTSSEDLKGVHQVNACMYLAKAGSYYNGTTGASTYDHSLSREYALPANVPVILFKRPR